MTTLTRTTARSIQTEALAALKAVAEKYGMVVTPKTGSIGMAEVTLKFAFTVTAAETGVPANFASRAKTLGLPEDCYGKTFKVGRIEYRISDINLNAPTYPVLAERVRDGRRFKFGSATVKFSLTK